MALSLGVYLFAGSRQVGLLFFAAQLILNLSWSPVFFGLWQPGAGVLIALGMLLFTGLTIEKFAERSPLSGYLLLPYFAWLIFAFYLNAYIWWWNP